MIRHVYIIAYNELTRVTITNKRERKQERDTEERQSQRQREDRGVGVPNFEKEERGEIR